MINEVKRFFKENYKLIVATFLIGLLAHGFAVTNKLIGYDELSYVFDKGSTLPSARWGLELVSLIFPDISMPWYNGILALIILSISFALVVDIFQIKNKHFKILICGVLITFPAITSTYIYMYTVTAYSISIFLSVISVALLRSKKLIFNILAIITMILSLSIYQSYICITMVMLIMLVMKDCINEKTSIKEIMRNILKYIIYIIISLVAYLMVTKIINYTLDITLCGYKGLDSMGKFTIKDIINGIIISYKNIYNLFPDEGSIGNTFAFNSFIKVFVFIVLLLTVCLTIVKFAQLIKKKEISKAIVLLILLIIQPIAINFIIVVNPKIYEIYSVMIYQYVFLIIEPIILYEWFGFKKIKNIVCAVFIIVIFQFVTIANELHFKLYLSYESIYSFSSGLVNRVVKTEGYDKSTPVTFIGIYKEKQKTNYHDYFGKIISMGGYFDNDDTIRPDMRHKFIKYFIGIDLKYLYEDNIEVINIKKTPEFKQMNVYPYNNSIKKINGIVVVKFSE